MRYGPAMRCLRVALLTSLLSTTTTLMGACDRAPPLMVWVDGFAPENVSFDVEDLAAAGAAVLMISSDLEEILRLSDRVLVMHEGRIAGELARAGFEVSKGPTVARYLRSWHCTKPLR